MDSWLAGLEASEFRPLLAVLFDRYVEATMEHCRRNFRAVVPLPAVSQAATVCQILGSLLPKARAASGPACPARLCARRPPHHARFNMKNPAWRAPQETVRGTPPPDKRLLEHQFVFACVWAFGGTMLVDKVSDYRAQFSKWWVAEWKAVPFPDKARPPGMRGAMHAQRRGRGRPTGGRGREQGLVFDYYVDEAAVAMVSWEARVPAFAYAPDASAAVFVPTMETARLTYLLDTLIARRHHVMFVGSTGARAQAACD